MIVNDPLHVVRVYWRHAAAAAAEGSNKGTEEDGTIIQSPSLYLVSDG